MVFPCILWVSISVFKLNLGNTRRRRNRSPIAPSSQGSLAPPPPPDELPEFDGLVPDELELLLDDEELLELLEELELVARVTVTDELTTSLPVLLPINTVYAPVSLFVIRATV